MFIYVYVLDYFGNVLFFRLNHLVGTQFSCQNILIILTVTQAMMSISLLCVIGLSYVGCGVKLDLSYDLQSCQVFN